MPNKIIRRNFLRSSLLASAGLILSNISGCHSKTRSLEEFISFPEEIPGADKVEKFPIDGAKKCLVHIRQEHHIDYNPHDSIDKIFEEHKPTKRELERINSHQKCIYEILDFLRKNRFTDSVYLEGIDAETLDALGKIHMVPKNEELMREFEDLEQKLRQRIIWNVPEGYAPEKLIQEYQQKLEEVKKSLKEHNEKYKYYYGGALRLVLEGKIKPRFEDLSISDKAYKEYERTRKMGFMMMDAREDFILKSIAENREKIAVVPFGGAHAFGGKESCGVHYNLGGRKSYKDNIAEWNKKNPDKKFCLVEIIPKGYD